MDSPVKTFDSRIERNFTYHPPSHEETAKYEQLRQLAKDFAYLLENLCPDIRERSLAMTSLETTVMWANASIARDPAKFGQNPKTK